MDNRFTYLLHWFRERNIPLTLQELRLLGQHTGHQTIPRNELIMWQHRPVNRFFFFNSGVARLFLKHHDRDITVAFICAPQFASTINYLLNQVPSTLAIETCTEVEALSWERSDMLAFREKSAFGHLWEVAFTELLLAWNMEREVDRLTLTPEERYHKLLQTAPEIPRLVPVKHIASYLGIHQDSLSRIRNRMAKRI